MFKAISRRAAITQIAGGLALAGCATGRSSAVAGPDLQKASAMTVENIEGVFNLYIANGRPLVLLSSGDSLPVPVLFDTGTSGNMIDVSVFQQFGLEKKPDHVSFITDASGTMVETYATVFPEARLGSLSISNATMDVSNYRVTDEAGIIGPELFRGRLVYLNMPRRSVYIRKAHTKPVNISDAHDYISLNGSGLPAMPISIAGHSKSMVGLIDTGKNGALSFPESMIDELPLVASPREVGTATTMFKTVPVYGAQIDAEILIGTKTLVRPDVIFHGDTPKIGMPVLEQQRIWLEPHKQRSWIASARTLEDARASEFTGKFGTRTIRRGSSGLIYQREGSPERRLLYMGGDHFLFDHDQTDLIFRRDDADTVNGFTLLGETGRPYEVTL